MAGQRMRDFAQITEIEGLKELRRDLRDAGPEMAKRLQQVNKRLVSDVAEKARHNFYPRVPGKTPSTRPSGRGSVGRSRDSIRANAGQTSASIVAGGPKAPGFFGHEFGGGARPRTRQFPVHRGRDGYVLYPVVRKEMRTAGDDWARIFDELFNEE